MSEFPQPDSRPVKPGMYKTFEPYRYEWPERSGALCSIEIPEGFIYDGASVPRPLWSLAGIRPDGLLRAAALVHDFIYRHKGAVPVGSRRMRLLNGIWVDDTRPFTRAQADRLFYQIMLAAGVSKAKAWIAWVGVRSGGWLPWKNHDKRKQ